MAYEKLDLFLNNSFLKKNNSLLFILEAIEKFADLDRKYLQNYQVLLLECLDSDDETIKHMSIWILFKNVNETNIELVIEKIQKFLICTPDMLFKKWTLEKLF